MNLICSVEQEYFFTRVRFHPVPEKRENSSHHFIYIELEPDIIFHICEENYILSIAKTGNGAQTEVIIPNSAQSLADLWLKWWHKIPSGPVLNALPLYSL